MKTDFLIVNLEELMLLDTYSSKEYKFDVNLIDEEDVFFTKPLKVITHLTKEEEGIVADIDVSGVIELECSRCLERFEQKLKIHINDMFENNFDDEERRINEESEIDLLPIVRAEIILSLPIKRLCKENCKVDIIKD